MLPVLVVAIKSMFLVFWGGVSNETSDDRLLSTPMGVDYVVIGFDMKVQPLFTHKAA